MAMDAVKGDAEEQVLPVVTVFKDQGGKWRWHLKGRNGEIVCTGEDHSTSNDAIRAVERVESLFAMEPNIVIDRSTHV